jgi:iron(III) transport system ATP-binding protein
MVAISIRNLTKQFGSATVLDRVSMEISAGEMFFLLGPSGCGKTTLLRHIAGFYQQDSGQILFDEKDMTGVPAHKRNTAMMFQSYALWPHLTVAENVAFGLEERKIARPEIDVRVAEALTMVQLGNLGARKINQLSGGQQQRVALARSLAVRPSCLLLDEPLSNLDAKLRLEMRGEIKRICHQFGLTAIYVTHDQKEALHLADRMAIMERGVVRQIGTPQEIYRRPTSATVAAFIGEANLMHGTFEGPGPKDGIYSALTTQGRISGLITNPDWHPEVGDPVQVCVRPEAWQFVNWPEPRNNFSGFLSEVIYLGEVAQYSLTNEGTTIRMAELNPATLREVSAETEVHVAVRPEDVMILPAASVMAPLGA